MLSIVFTLRRKHDKSKQLINRISKYLFCIDDYKVNYNTNLNVDSNFFDLDFTFSFNTIKKYISFLNSNKYISLNNNRVTEICILNIYLSRILWSWYIFIVRLSDGLRNWIQNKRTFHVLFSDVGINPRWSSILCQTPWPLDPDHLSRANRRRLDSFPI